MKNMIGVYLNFLDKCEKAIGIFNDGFENIYILNIAKKVTEHVSSEIEIAESNDPRSYLQNSDRLIGTGFTPKIRH